MEMLESHEQIVFQDAPILHSVDLPAELGLEQLPSGKVRDRYAIPDGINLVLVTTDRISAFDRVLGTIPYKGQILNRLSAFWFDQMADIIPNHMVATPDPNVMVVKKATPLPVEVVVRGYMTGVTDTSIWGSYERGERDIYGIHFRDGYKKNDPLDEPIITPTTKAAKGHDERLTEAEIIEKEIVDPMVWGKVRTSALAIFKRAQQIAAEKGFTLVDTKMEFGLDEDGQPILIDELLTPDSSRYWLAASADEKIVKGEEPDNFDKEYLRLAYKAMGYGGEGAIPDEVPLQIRQETARRYIALFETITGQEIEAEDEQMQLRIYDNLRQWVQSQTESPNI